MANQLISKLLKIFMVISWVVLFSLSILAGFRQDWFGLGVLLAICAIILLICTGILMALKIDTCTKHLEELITKNKDLMASNEQSEEAH